MKAKLVFLVVLATVLLTQAGFAATSSMFVNVPFQFTVNDTEMPAGRYLVSRITENAVALQLENGAKSLFVLTHSKERLSPEDLGELVFDRFGSRYFLAEVWERNSGTGRELQKPKLEKIAKHQQVAVRAVGD